MTAEEIRTEIQTAAARAALRAQSPQVTTEEAQALSGRESDRGFRDWAYSHGIRCIRLGYWSRAQILRALEREVQAAARRPASRRGAHNRKAVTA